MKPEATKGAAPVSREIVALRFADHGRTGKTNAATRELKRGAQDGSTFAEDLAGRGVWIDGRILVPWSNLLWAEYE